MHEENNRAAICAVIRSSPEHLTKTQIANKAGIKVDDSHFVQVLKKYLKKEGDGWRCTAATAAKRSKQYELV